MSLRHDSKPEDVDLFQDCVQGRGVEDVDLFQDCVRDLFERSTSKQLHISWRVLPV
jgi:hypothetical protein